MVHEHLVLLIGVEPQPTIRTAEGLRRNVDATIADDLVLDVMLVPGANNMDHLLYQTAVQVVVLLRKLSTAARTGGLRAARHAAPRELGND